MPDDVELITFVGRVVPWKGPREFIAAMAVVARQHNNTRFLLVGDANETPEYVAELRQQINAEGLHDRVTFIEHLSDMQAAYRASSVLIHASIEPEPFGMVVIEAMQAGTPVVAARSGGPLEIIEDGVSGLLVDPTNTAELAAAVIRLLDDAPLRQSIIAAAERRVADRFSMSRAVEGLSHCYEQVLASVRPRGKYQAGRVPAAELMDKS
jgi:glycosyltransferase involved in cell wall biosynthesis